ncbi:MAG: hypothetical protein IH946_06450, partial [Bacteroidetes bacterium]|nr:hypothetical protein [Bacteroidota bacterium]
MKTLSYVLFFCLALISFRGTSQTYCTPNYTYGTNLGDFIDGVELSSISNTNTGGTNGPTYNDYTSMSTDLTQSFTLGLWITSGDDQYITYTAWI